MEISKLIYCIFKERKKREDRINIINRHSNSTKNDALDSLSLLLKDDLINISKEAIGSDIIITDSFFTILGAGGSVSNNNHINLIDKVPI